MKKFYIAFSIHSTKAFVSAAIETADFMHSDDGQIVTIKNRQFTVARSRRPSYDLASDGEKLHAKELLTKDGKPLRSPPLIAQFFNQLEREGWTVNKSSFLQKHWHAKEPVAA